MFASVGFKFCTFFTLVPPPTQHVVTSPTQVTKELQAAARQTFLASPQTQAIQVSIGGRVCNTRRPDTTAEPHCIGIILYASLCMILHVFLLMGSLRIWKFVDYAAYAGFCTLIWLGYCWLGSKGGSGEESECASWNSLSLWNRKVEGYKSPKIWFEAAN